MAFKKTSKQNLGHYTGTTLKFGELIPVQCLEAVQGDTFRLQTQAFLRLAPMVFPVIQPIWIRLHHWFVPIRTLWCGFEDFITGKDLTSVLPYCYNPRVSDASVFPPSSPLVRMGVIPAGKRWNKPTPFLPLLAYWKIWCEFYADEQLDEAKINRYRSFLDSMMNKTNSKILKGGDLDVADIMLSGAPTFHDTLRVAYHKDYFTGARPTPTIGPEITINATAENGLKETFGLKVKTTGPYTDVTISDQASHGYLTTPVELAEGIGHFQMHPDSPDGSLPFNIKLSELMAGFALQRIFQKQNEYGNRYQEWLANQGVRYSDKSLQLPQYIGGGKDLFDVNEVIQTSANITANPLGQFAGRGTASVSSRVCYHYCEEPGFIMTLASIVPKNMYEIQGIRKNWARRTFEETYQPELEHLDMQPIKNGEIFLQESESDKEVFGYTPRYDELRTAESFVSGDLVKGRRYESFTMSRAFSELPVLNSSFIQCNPDNSIFYDKTSDPVIGVFKNKTIARRHLIKRSHIKLV